MGVYNTEAKEIMKSYIDRILAEEKQVCICHHNFSDVALLVSIDSHSIWVRFGPYEEGKLFTNSKSLADGFETKADALAWAIKNNHDIYTFDFDIDDFVYKKYEEESKIDNEKNNKWDLSHSIADTERALGQLHNDEKIRDGKTYVHIHGQTMSFDTGLIRDLLGAKKNSLKKNGPA